MAETYAIAAFVNLDVSADGIPDGDELDRQIAADVTLNGLTYTGCGLNADATFTFNFAAALTAPQTTALDAIVTAHTGIESPLFDGGEKVNGIISAVPPTVDDDITRGITPSTIWVVPGASGQAYINRDNAQGAALWQVVGDALTGGDKNRITADDTVTDYLGAKLVPGTDIALDVLGAAGTNQTLRVRFTGTGAGGGISEAQHNALRQLIHFIDNGPTDGFASGSYSEQTYTGARHDSEIWYVDNTKADKIVEFNALTFTGIFPLTEEWKMYDVDGSTVLITLLDTITYNGAFEATRTRTWS